MVFLDYLHRVASHSALTSAEAEQALGLVLEGQASAPLLAAFLVALRMKGETPAEVLGFTRAMRARSLRVDVSDVSQPVLDTCGTGGDASGSFNISTVAALVVAGAGVRVAKHGNRSMASHCGSADILEALGVKIALAPDRMADCLRRAGIGFLFAPALHPAITKRLTAVVPATMLMDVRWDGLRRAREAAKQRDGKAAASPSAMMAWCIVRAQEKHAAFRCLVSKDGDRKSVV